MKLRTSFWKHGTVGKVFGGAYLFGVGLNSARVKEMAEDIDLAPSKEALG